LQLISYCTGCTDQYKLAVMSFERQSKILFASALGE